MIKRILLICLITLSFSCQDEAKENFTIIGTAEGVVNGTEVKLQELLNNRPVLLTSTTVENEAFSFTGSIKDKEMHFIVIKGIQGNLPIILENADIDVVINTQNLNQSSIKGTEDNELLIAYGEKLRDTNKKNQELNVTYQEAQRATDESKMNAVTKSFESNKQAQIDYELNFVKTHNKSLISILVLERMMYSRTATALEIKELFDALSKDVRESTSGKNVSKALASMLATAEGSKAPNFEAPNPDGQLVALNDITSKGKVTIVDFWAAWCGPCRRENPNLVRIYEKYHDKGLEIVGVSLDGSTKQPDPKGAWLKAIKDDGLTWHQVSNLKYFQDPIAEAYNIRAIPATFLLDTDGKIIGKELRGRALEEKIAELLD